MWTPIVLQLLLLTSISAVDNKNVIFISLNVAGYSDFQTHDPLMVTPNIKALREDGVFLNQSYVQPLSQSTRAAWMTGRLPFTFGYQDTIPLNDIRWIDKDTVFLPERFQNYNYKTHLVGFWGLGFCSECLTPLSRGFNTFYGALLGTHDSAVNHTRTKENITMYDWWYMCQVDYSARGHYMIDLLNARAENVIRESFLNQPFFLHLSYDIPHDSNEVPQNYKDFCPDVLSPSRLTRCAIMAAIDKGVGDLVAALKEKDLYSQTVILLTSTCGGQTRAGANNYPLRGGKTSIFEGGIRSYTILRDPSFTETNITWPGMIHAVDWVPTLLSAACSGCNVTVEGVRGMNLYNEIKNGDKSAREAVIIVNDAERFNHLMVIHQKWKMIRAFNETKPWRTGTRNSDGWSNVTAYGILLSYPLKVKPQTESLLFNLNEDPSERNPLSMDKVPEILPKLNKYLPYFLKGNTTLHLEPVQEPHHSDDFAKDGVPSRSWCPSACSPPVNVNSRR